MSQSVGELIDKAYELREESRKLNKKAEEIDKERKEIEVKLLEAMDSQKLDQTRGKVATATISQQVMPQVEDWDKFYTFISKHKAFYLLERRAAAAPYRELLETRKGRLVPGVTSFLKRSISLRTRGD